VWCSDQCEKCRKRLNYETSHFLLHWCLRNMWIGNLWEDQFAWILLTTCEDHKGYYWRKMWGVENRRRYHVALAAGVYGGWPVERSKTSHSCGASPPPTAATSAAPSAPTAPAGAAQQNRKQAGAHSCCCCNALQWSVAVDGCTRLHEPILLCTWL